MNTRELFEQRIRLIRDTWDHKKTERVPFMGNIQAWMLLDAGYTILEAGRDYSKCEDAGRRLLQQYNMDMVSCGGGFVRTSTQIHDALGQNGTQDFLGDGNGFNVIYENELIHADEYDEMISDYDKTIWEKAFFRAFQNARGYSLEQWVNAAKATKENMDAKTAISLRMREEFGIADQLFVPHALMQVDNLLNYQRGLRGLSLDLRRRPDKVEELCRIRDEMTTDQCIAMMESIQGRNMNEPYDVMMSCLAHILMTRKQFEKLYLPSLQKLGNYCQTHHKQMAFNTEGDWMKRFGDFFNDFEKGVINCIVEQDDPFEVRKQLPNVGIIGGLSVEVMGKGSVEDCLNMAKRAIDEIGRDGGLVLAPNKFVTYAHDMKRENLKAVGQFVLEYRG